MIALQGPSQIITNDEVLNVVRVGQLIYQDGKPLQRAVFNFQIICNVQPLEGRQLLLVPEGDRYKEQYWVWMNQCELPLEINDKILRPGLDLKNQPTLVPYQVQQIENWGSYTQARMVRIDVGPSENP